MKKIIKILSIAFLAGGVLFWFYNMSLHFTDDTLGGFPDRNFLTSKKRVEEAIDNIYLTNPEFKIPDKWRYEDTSIKRSYFFLEGIFFYFKSNPEEMYYMTFIGDSATLKNQGKTTIAIRLVNLGGPKWFKYKEFDSAEKKRIEGRFDREIIPKIESFINVRPFKPSENL